MPISSALSLQPVGYSSERKIGDERGKGGCLARGWRRPEEDEALNRDHDEAEDHHTVTTVTPDGLCRSQIEIHATEKERGFECKSDQGVVPEPETYLSSERSASRLLSRAGSEKRSSDVSISPSLVRRICGAEVRPVERPGSRLRTRKPEGDRPCDS